jgi:hypothetical protein
MARGGAGAREGLLMCDETTGTPYVQHVLDSCSGRCTRPIEQPLNACATGAHLSRGWCDLRALRRPKEPRRISIAQPRH